MKQDLKRSADGFVVILPGPDRDVVYRPDSFSPGGGRGFYTRAEAVEVLRKMHRGRERAGCPYTPETEPYAESSRERFTLEDADAGYPCLIRLPGDPPYPDLPPDDPRGWPDPEPGPLPDDSRGFDRLCKDIGPIGEKQ